MFSLENGRAYEEWRCRIGDDEKEEIIENYGMHIVQSGAHNKVLRYMDKKSRQERHAEMFYETIKKDKYDVDKIAKNTGYPKKMIQTIKNYIFYEKHNLLVGYTNFTPDFAMAVSWQRLRDGKDIHKCDFTLLKHEFIELMHVKKYNKSVTEAHDLANSIFNFSKEWEDDINDRS